MKKLGVNIDHVATVREARGGFEPDPVTVARICENAGANSIVAHLREDRRHIKENDLSRLIKVIKTNLNLEMSIAPDIVKKALKIKPFQATLVPEKRKELTTEGGLDVCKGLKKIKKVVGQLEEAGIRVSLFIDPGLRQIDALLKTGAQIVEIHTGCYANAKNENKQKLELKKIEKAVQHAFKKGLVVNAGHGLNYKNVKDIAGMREINELNIGHSIISHAVYVGISNAVLKMKELIG